MTPERWQQVKEVLAAALEREPVKRAAYLDQVCAEPSLRREVESLIAAHEQGDGSFMAAVFSRTCGVRADFSGGARSHNGRGKQSPERRPVASLRIAAMRASQPQN